MQAGLGIRRSEGLCFDGIVVVGYSVLLGSKSKQHLHLYLYIRIVHMQSTMVHFLSLEVLAWDKGRGAPLWLRSVTVFQCSLDCCMTLAFVSHESACRLLRQLKLRWTCAARPPPAHASPSGGHGQPQGDPQEPGGLRGEPHPDDEHPGGHGEALAPHGPGED